LVLAACTNRDVVISEILIDRLPGAETLTMERAELRTLVESTMSEHGKFVLKPNTKSGGILRVQYGTDRANSVYLTLKYEKPDDAQSPRLGVSRWITFSTPQEFRSALASGLGTSLEELYKQAFEQNKEQSALQTISDYAQGKNVGESAVIKAITQIEENKDPNAVKPLMLILKSSHNIRIALKALSALGTLGDPASIDAITEFAERKIPEVRRHVIEALRKIGGKSAAAWLFTMSTGYGDDAVRAAAAEALKDVESRMAKKK
jgi:hypothetical protein